MNNSIIARQKMYTALLSLEISVKDGRHRGDITPISMCLEHKNGKTEFRYQYYLYGTLDCETLEIIDSDKLIFESFNEEFKDCFEDSSTTATTSGLLHGKYFSLLGLADKSLDALRATQTERVKLKMVNSIQELIAKSEDSSNSIDFDSFNFSRHGNELILFYKTEEFGLSFHKYRNLDGERYISLEGRLKSVLSEIAELQPMGDNKAIECIKLQYSEICSIYNSLNDKIKEARAVAEAYTNPYY